MDIFIIIMMLWLSFWLDVANRLLRFSLSLSLLAGCLVWFWSIIFYLRLRSCLLIILRHFFFVFDNKFNESF